MHGDLDVLIASSAIATGVDGLQTVCDQLIINVLPWTHAEFEQLLGRIYRQGQQANTVTVVIPKTTTMLDNQEWSYCGSKWQRICFKRSIAESAVDGILPEGTLTSSDSAHRAMLSWIQRLEKAS